MNKLISARARAMFVTKLIAVGLGLFLVACDRKTDVPTASTPTTVSLRQEWFPNSNYAGALVASREFAPSAGINLVVQPGADNIDPIKLVLSGESTFGDAGADKILAANQKGAGLLIIGVLNNASPTCFLAKKEANIQTPMDFKGKKVGVLAGTSTEYVYRTLLSKLNISKSDFTEIDAPFDLATFLAGQYDVRPAFIYDEPVSLDLKQVQYTVIRPEKYGVFFLGTVYFTTKKYATEHPELVQKFINSVARGWSVAGKDPGKAIGYLKEYDKTTDSARELLALNKSLEYFAGYKGQVLSLDPAAWEQTVKNLKQLGVIDSANMDASLDMHFVDEFPRLAK
jgi:NitT/TauT family transport system substrate-binding protein